MTQEKVMYNHDEYYDWTDVNNLTCQRCLTPVCRIVDASKGHHYCADCRNKTIAIKRPVLSKNNWIVTDPCLAEPETRCNVLIVARCSGSVGVRDDYESDMKKSIETMKRYINYLFFNEKFNICNFVLLLGNQVHSMEVTSQATH